MASETSLRWWQDLAQYSYHVYHQEVVEERNLPCRVKEAVAHFFLWVVHATFCRTWGKYENYYNSLKSDSGQRMPSRVSVITSSLSEKSQSRKTNSVNSDSSTESVTSEEEQSETYGLREEGKSPSLEASRSGEPPLTEGQNEEKEVVIPGLGEVEKEEGSGSKEAETLGSDGILETITSFGQRIFGTDNGGDDEKEADKPFFGGFFSNLFNSTQPSAADAQDYYDKPPPPLPLPEVADSRQGKRAAPVVSRNASLPREAELESIPELIDEYRRLKEQFPEEAARGSFVDLFEEDVKESLKGVHPPSPLSQELAQALTPLLEQMANDAEIEPGAPEVLSLWMRMYPLISNDDDQVLMKNWVSCLYYASEFALGLSEEKRRLFVQNLHSFYIFWKEETRKNCDMDKLLWLAFINVRQAWVQKAERNPEHERLGITLDEITALESSGFEKLKRWEHPLRHIEAATRNGLFADFCLIDHIGKVQPNVSIGSLLLSEDEAIRKGRQAFEEGQHLFEIAEIEVLRQPLERAIEELRARGNDRGMEELFVAMNLLFGVR